MLIKSSSDRADDLQTLQGLLSHPAADQQTRSRVEQEIRNIRAGLKGEAEAAYEIEFHYKQSRNWAILHDLRVEFQGRVSQIDHVLINRFLDVWVCESKHFSEGIAINEHGEFTAFYGGRAYGVPSPLEQNRKHIAVLQAIFGSSIFSLPTRLGVAIRPAVHSVVLVSKGARISRPKVKVDGLDAIIKNDQLKATIDRRIDDESGLSTIISATRIVGPDTLEDFAHQLARLHRPITFDWRSKFGLAIGAAPAEVDRDAKAKRIHVDPKVTAQSTPAQNSTSAELERLSTSKLAAKLGLRNAGELLDRLTALGYLVRNGDVHELTGKGVAAGAVFVEKSRFGPYFLWPADMHV